MQMKGSTLQDASSSCCFGEMFFITSCKLFSLLLKLVPHYKMQVLLTTPQNGPSLHARCKLSPPFLRMVLHYTQDASSPRHSWEWSFIARGKLSPPLLRMVLHYQRLALLTCPWNRAVGILFCVEIAFMSPASASLKEVSSHVLVASHMSATLSAAERHHRCCPHPASNGERQTLLLACAHFLCAPARLNCSCESCALHAYCAHPTSTQPCTTFLQHSRAFRVFFVSWCQQGSKRGEDPLHPQSWLICHVARMARSSVYVAGVCYVGTASIVDAAWRKSHDNLKPAIFYIFLCASFSSSQLSCCCEESCEMTAVCVGGGGRGVVTGITFCTQLWNPWRQSVKVVQYFVFCNWLQKQLCL